MGANLWLSEWSAQNATQNGTQDAATRDYYLGVYGGLGVMQGVYSQKIIAKLKNVRQ